MHPFETELRPNPIKPNNMSVPVEQMQESNDTCLDRSHQLRIGARRLERRQRLAAVHPASERVILPLRLLYAFIFVRSFSVCRITGKLVRLVALEADRCRQANASARHSPSRLGTIGAVLLGSVPNPMNPK